MTDREKNEKIAKWLGFVKTVDHSFEEDTAISTWHSPDCKCHAEAANDKCDCIAACYWGDDGEAPDFLHSEEASALALEGLPHPLLVKEIIGNQVRWSCNYHFVDGVTQVNADRKTAIRDACIAWIERGV